MNLVSREARLVGMTTERRVRNAVQVLRLEVIRALIFRIYWRAETQELDELATRALAKIDEMVA